MKIAFKKLAKKEKADLKNMPLANVVVVERYIQSPLIAIDIWSEPRVGAGTRLISLRRMETGNAHCNATRLV